MKTEWTKQTGGWSPIAALESAAQTKWIVDGVIPAASIVWVAGKPACFKTFAILDMVGAVSAGRPWQGRICEQATVIYIAAEGGADVHIRRAAMELAAGSTGLLNIVQTRPQIGEPEGLAELMQLVSVSTNDRVTFPLVQAYDSDTYRQYLTADESDLHDRMDAYADLTGRTGLRMVEARELTALEEQLTPPQKVLALDSWDHFQALTEGRRLPVERAMLKHRYSAAPNKSPPNKNVLVVIDTYSQTSADDTKSSVSRFIKNLRDLIEQSGDCVSAIVIDHLTKDGGSFMGALAKQGDSDVMIEVDRRGNLVTLSCPEKMKAGRPFDPIHLELVPYTLDGYHDALGRPLSTLAVKDGTAAQRLRQIVGANGDTTAAMVLGLLETTGPCSQKHLRQQFTEHPANVQKKADSVSRAFSRAIEALTDDEIVHTVDGLLHCTSLASP
jgi:hypothetical protein